MTLAIHDGNEGCRRLDTTLSKCLDVRWSRSPQLTSAPAPAPAPALAVFGENELPHRALAGTAHRPMLEGRRITASHWWPALGCFRLLTGATWPLGFEDPGRDARVMWSAGEGREARRKEGEGNEFKKKERERGQARAVSTSQQFALLRPRNRQPASPSLTWNTHCPPSVHV